MRRLNEAGIPVTAWIALPKEEGYYLNAANAYEAAARFAAFETWTRDYGLRWARVGLDIEPSLQDLGAALQGHWLRLAGTVVRRCFDTGSVDRARNAYAALIRRIQGDGYDVETYQFPFLADERKVHSTLLERVFGIVDIRGDREVLMTYTSFDHALDSALIWAYGPEAQLMVVGSTAGDPEPGGKFGPLSWDELTHDVVVASHFSPVVGVYSLEGCVRRGFLSRLKTMKWGPTLHDTGGGEPQGRSASHAFKQPCGRVLTSPIWPPPSCFWTSWLPGGGTPEMVRPRAPRHNRRDSSSDQLLQIRLGREDVGGLFFSADFALDSQWVGVADLLELFDDHGEIHFALTDGDLLAELFRVRGI